VLGIVQGLTEFAPVSSSGHLILVPWLFHWSILNNEVLNKTFDVALHMGTFVGAVVYFWRDIVKYLRAWVHSINKRAITRTNERLAWALVIGTIPGAVAGALFEDTIDKKLGQPWLIAVMLAVFGVVLYVVDKKMASTRGIRDLRIKDGLLVGIVQAAALQPGVSRSGITMTVGRLLKVDRETAARFSFLLSLPIIGGAGAYTGAKLLLGKEHIPAGFGGPFTWGIIASAVSGFLVIWGLLKYLRRHDFLAFAIYRIAVALLVFGVIVSGARPGTI